MPAKDRLDCLAVKIVAEPALHARWLNTFSYLEYVGFRKIVKSQRAEYLTAAILGHACEEGCHALSLKKLAVKLGGAEFDSYSPEVLLCDEEAKTYFQELDQSCEGSPLISSAQPPIIASNFQSLAVLLMFFASSRGPIFGPESNFR